MKLHLHNTLTRKTEPVVPMDGETLRVYACGPTVYGPAHIGNFRTFVLQDLFRRLVEALGTPTKHVRNITDVDDKTIRDALAANQTLADFTTHWRGLFEADAAALNLLEPHIAPAATDHIAEQISLIETLMEKGLAYATDDGSVYYRIAAFADYGKLAGLQVDALQQNADARLNDADEYEKESARDFVLWKAWKEADGPNKWDSPWGPGRPGWHLECSAMSMKYLGPSFDVHSGGIDLCFPHHENEIAQSEGATDERFARHWFHIAHLRVEGQKMSKSLGNLHTLEEVQSWGYTAAELRYVLLSGHYRQPLNFSRSTLKAAQSALKRVVKIAQKLSTTQAAFSKDTDELGRFAGVFAALADDLNTPKALGALHKALGEIEGALKKNALDDSAKEAELNALYQTLWAFGLENVLDALAEEATAAQNGTAAEAAPPEIVALAEERQTARKAKDWAAADAAREAIIAAGWELRESRDGYELLKK